MREKPKTAKAPVELTDVLETYGVATLASAVIGAMYFIVPYPGFEFTLLAILNGFCLFCLLICDVWIGISAFGKMKDPEKYENVESPDPIRLHQKKEQMIAFFKGPKP